MHLAGLNLHIHVIGDRGTRTAVDAIEAARAADGNIGTHDSLAHIQFAAPEDVARMGRDHLYLVYTYSWAMHDPDYDPSVFPYLSENPDDPYFEEQMYPVRQSQDAGAVLAAGSDAPVASRDPRPFVNMALAVTRRQPGGRTLSKAQTISIEAAIDAYTLHGAQMILPGCAWTRPGLTAGASIDGLRRTSGSCKPHRTVCGEMSAYESRNES
jgi:predicted amidohydrolase YtcJ